MTKQKDILYIVQDIWREELPIQSFSLEDDFFDLGGNSLRLIAVLDKLQKREELQNIQLTILELFDHPVLKDIVSLIEEKIKSS